MSLFSPCLVLNHPQRPPLAAHGPSRPWALACLSVALMVGSHDLAAEELAAPAPTLPQATSAKAKGADKPGARTKSKALVLAPAKPAASARPGATTTASPAAIDENAERCVSAKETALPSLLGQPDQGQVLAEGETPAQQRLQELVKATLQRSHIVGALALLAEASVLDVQEARAAQDPQASANLGLGPHLGRDSGINQSNALRLSAGAQMTGTLFDGGRSDRLIDWRRHLADAARQGALNTQEQLALNTVSLALERSRFRLQTVIYDQQIEKMTCLAKSLETVVQLDRGRASELVQAKKSLQQAELSRHQAQATLRQIENRLRKLVGDGLPPVQGLVFSYPEPEPLSVLSARATQAAEVRQLQAQAEAAVQYVQALEASKKPQVGWSLGGQTAQGAGGSLGRSPNSTNLSFGITVNIPLNTQGVDTAIAAASKRAQATLMQRDEAIKGRQIRLEDAYLQGQSLRERLQQLTAILDNTQQLRSSTLQQWQQLGRRSLFDVMSAESEHTNLQVQYVNGLHDQQQMRAVVQSMVAEPKVVEP